VKRTIYTRSDSTAKQLPDGKYVAKIIDVEDNPIRQYLKLDYEICEGPHECHFLQLYEKYGQKFWPGVYYQGYSASAERYYGDFLAALEMSNGGFVFDSENEKSLIGKYIGLCVKNETYYNGNGEERNRVKVIYPLSADQVRAENAAKEQITSNGDGQYLPGVLPTIPVNGAHAECSTES